MRTIMICLLLGCSGCSVHKMNFECKGVKGLGCKSVSEVNEIITVKKPPMYICFKEDNSCMVLEK